MKKTKILLLLLLLNFNLCMLLGVKAEEATVQAPNAKYVTLSVTEYKELKTQALSFDSLVRRVQELEQLYLQIKDIVIAINETIAFIKRMFNIQEVPRADLDANKVSDEFKHFSGVVMSPGWLDFQAALDNSVSSFKAEGVKVLDLDIYYNKKLFMLDHIESKQLDVVNLERIPLSNSISSSRDRVRIPISDSLNNKLDFTVYLAPLSKAKIKVGDKTKIRVVNYKRTTRTKKKPGVGQVAIRGSSSYVVVKSKA